MNEQRLSELDLAGLCDRDFSPSPAAWEDQVFYFLMLDRFSDGTEKGCRDNSGGKISRGKTPLFQPADAGNAIKTEEDARAWRDAGGGWVGGSLKGLTGKIGYLKRLGVTAIWVSPVFSQVAFQETYHGYGIQNFLEVDPHFGTREELREMVETAHHHGIYVILDIILNHAGNVFAYDPNRHWTRDEKTGNSFLDPRWDGGLYDVRGFNDAAGNPALPFAKSDPAASPPLPPDGALWPMEFQDPAFFTRKGRISNWDHNPEYLEGDFCDLKNIQLGFGDIDNYQPSQALLALCQIYRFWIAYADVDGFRVDTVKHMDLGATRFFTAVIHEFAESIGKENFYLIGEITGERKDAYQTLELTGLDAALGIGDVQNKLEGVVKGFCNPEEYFGLFRNSTLLQKESHLWFKDKVVVTCDDHDQIRRGERKARFCSSRPGEKLKWERQMLNLLALNATTLGIPCLYYGSEQCFDGEGGGDRYIREAMFGGEFGAFRSRDRHFFNEESPVCRELAKILALRRDRIALRRGRQYLREISGDGVAFGLPRKTGEGSILSVIPWSRIYGDKEMLLAVNTDCDAPRTAWVTIDAGLHQAGEPLRCVYSTDEGQVGRETKVEAMNGKAVQLTVPAAGFVIFE